MQLLFLNFIRSTVSWQYLTLQGHPYNECPVPTKIGHHQMCSACFSQSSNTSVSIPIIQPQRQPSHICVTRIYARHTKPAGWQPHPAETWTPALTYSSRGRDVCLNMPRRSFEWQAYQQQALQRADEEHHTCSSSSVSAAVYSDMRAVKKVVDIKTSLFKHAYCKSCTNLFYTE